MPPAEAVYPLATGEALTVRVLEPPLGEYAERIECWWRDVRAPLLAGGLAVTSLDRFVVGEVGGAYAGRMTYAAPRDGADVAVLGMVWTREDQRRKGIARALLQHTLAAFRAGGGQAMYLCTTNPHAFALYARAGFRPLAGDGIRYLAPGSEDFDQSYFAPAGPATVRDATWGDLARAAALYNQPRPDWLVKDYHAPRRVFRAGRENGYDQSCQFGLGCFALLAAQEGDHARAARLLGAVTPQTRAGQRMHWPDVEAEAVAVEERARAALGEEAFERAWQQGRSMGVPQAVADALADAPDAPDAA